PGFPGRSIPLLATGRGYYGFRSRATITPIYPPIMNSGERIEAQLFPSGLVKVSKKNPMNIAVRPTIKVTFFRMTPASFRQGRVWEERLVGFPTISACSLFAGIRY
ncbi:MAG: hypothetical protein QME64_04170, partial [bacterium]|nr:hypothetical protein [bacterium]